MMIKEIKTDHNKQNGAGYCGLYALSNLVNDSNIIERKNEVEPDGGSSYEQLNKLLEYYELELGLLYYTINEGVPMLDKKAYYSDDFFKTMDDGNDDGNFVLLLVGLRGTPLNHWVAVIHFPRKKVFALVDSTRDYTVIFDDFSYLIKKYDIIELWNIRHSKLKTIDFQLLDNDCYVKTIVDNLE